MTIPEWIAEQRIAHAQRLGAFDGLAGRRQRLALDDDAAVPPEWRAAFLLLRSAGLAPEWMVMGREIDAERTRLQAALAEDGDAGPELRAEVAKLNRRIDGFNLLVPCASLQKPRLRT
jgi:hypothetical protein